MGFKDTPFGEKIIRVSKRYDSAFEYVRSKYCMESRAGQEKLTQFFMLIESLEDINVTLSCVANNVG